MFLRFRINNKGKMESRYKVLTGYRNIPRRNKNSPPANYDREIDVSAVVIVTIPR